jgi:hypothetical protein
MEDDLKKNKNGRRPQKKNENGRQPNFFLKNGKTTLKKLKTNQSIKINLIGCDTIVISTST